MLFTDKQLSLVNTELFPHRSRETRINLLFALEKLGRFEKQSRDLKVFLKRTIFPIRYHTKASLISCSLGFRCLIN